MPSVISVDNAPSGPSANSPPETSKSASTSMKEARLPCGKAKQADRYRYGNYSQYYGVRLEEKFQKDPRIELLREEWFRNKAVLDVGCNTGAFTLYIAKEWLPRRIVGLDIDQHLVGIARKNIRHYCDESVKMAGKLPQPIEKGPSNADAEPTFPDNVWFIKGNYVLESDEMLEMVTPEYNTILALSITKWIHLNWGDAGIKRFFKRCFAHLKPGGRLVLEPQDFSTYGKRARLSPDMKKTYESIKLKPADFSKYLLTEVGFINAEDLGVPKAKCKGFERPVMVFEKPKSE